VSRQFIFILLSVLILAPPVYSQGKDCVKPYRSQFRYFIIGNEVDSGAGDRRDARRSINVLLDDKSFSEANLKQLFRLLSKRFPKPAVLDVWVYSSMEVAPTPEEVEQPGMSEARWCDESFSDKFHWALYIRTKENEFFRYNPNPPKLEMKAVVLKGSAP
jgi:hypothetical protein